MSKHKCGTKCAGCGLRFQSGSYRDITCSDCGAVFCSHICLQKHLNPNGLPPERMWP